MARLGRQRWVVRSLAALQRRRDPGRGEQLLLGVLDVLLKAPGWAQLVHVFLAELIWVAYVLSVAARRDLGAPEAAMERATT